MVGAGPCAMPVTHFARESEAGCLGRGTILAGGLGCQPWHRGERQPFRAVFIIVSEIVSCALDGDDTINNIGLRGVDAAAKRQGD